MSTPSEVKSGLDNIAEIISANRATMISYKAGATQVAANLNALASAYSAVIATVNAYGTADAFEALSKAELAKMTAEFQALVADANAVAAIDLG